MTQVVTVSPTTAGYASDAYKARDSRYSPMETAISEWHARAVESGDAYDRSLLNVVRPPSLQLAFLTATHHQYRAVSVDQAIAEYASLERSKPTDGEVTDAGPAMPEQETAAAEPAIPAGLEEPAAPQAPTEVSTPDVGAPAFAGATE